ncbi:hypothetical protein [Capnocytophaga sp. HP1101]
MITKTGEGVNGRIAIELPKIAPPEKEATQKEHQHSHTARFGYSWEEFEYGFYDDKINELIVDIILRDKYKKCVICKGAIYDTTNMEQMIRRFKKIPVAGNVFYPNLCDTCTLFTLEIVPLEEVELKGERRQEYYYINNFTPIETFKILEILSDPLVTEGATGIPPWRGKNEGGGGNIPIPEEYIRYNWDVPDRMKDIIKNLSSFNSQGMPIPYVSKNDSHLTPFILNLFRPSTAYHITFRVGQLTSQSDYDSGQFTNGYTTKIPGITNYDITLDESLLREGSDLAVAQTIIHETLHAYMLMQLDRMKIEHQYNDMGQRLLLLYQNIKKKDTNITQHKLMTELIDAMAESLARYDRGQHTMDYYKQMAWGGLQETDEYKALPRKEREQIEKIWKYERTKNKP